MPDETKTVKAACFFSSNSGRGIFNGVSRSRLFLSMIFSYTLAMYNSKNFSVIPLRVQNIRIFNRYRRPV
jgi:hypothetical protein